MLIKTVARYKPQLDAVTVCTDSQGASARTRINLNSPSLEDSIHRAYTYTKKNPISSTTRGRRVICSLFMELTSGLSTFVDAILRVAARAVSGPARGCRSARPRRRSARHWTGKVESRVGDVALVPDWGWAIGSGLYLDELNEAKRLIGASTHATVRFVFESALVHMERGTGEAAGTLRHGLQQMRGFIRDTRKISHDLRPTMLDDEGLASAIKRIALEFGDRTGVAVEIKIGTLPTMADAVATAVFRVAQEALGNTERHAGATHIWLRLRHDAHGIELQLRDNGRGFNIPALLRKTRQGLGLTNMRERIEMPGGRFDLRSVPGGTTLTALIPTVALRR